MHAFPKTLSTRRATRRSLFAAVPVVGLMAAGWRSSPVLGRQATPASAFPVEIEHMYGITSIPAEPLRVMTIGYSEQDPVLALGVKPVAVREWFGGKPFATWPWAEEALGDAEPVVLEMPHGELDFERLIELNPDLIVATHSGITQEEYDRLVEIAPTVAQSGEYPLFGMPWQDQTRVIGRALGLASQADDRIADVGGQIAATAEAHPAFGGTGLAWINPSGDGTYQLVGPTTPPMRFFADLGFTFPEQLAEVVGDQESVQLSAEQLFLADTGVLVTSAASEDAEMALLDDPIFSQLDVVSDNRTIILAGADDPIYAALSFSTVLSLPFALKELTPLLEDAVGRL